jgi:hypothetical protein
MIDKKMENVEYFNYLGSLITNYMYMYMYNMYAWN